MEGEFPVDLLVNAVLDGGPVDWDSAEASASSDGHRTEIHHLRTLAAIGALHRGSDFVRVEMPAANADVWGPLQLLEGVGAGSYGEVFRAWDTKLAREVALKLIRHVAPTTDWNEDRALEEGRRLARIRHPNVVTVFGADRIGDRVGIWMEFIQGRTLQQVLQTHGAFSAREAAAIGLDLCLALSAVHRAGLLHRDLKAQNVMREDGGRIVLMDFGAGLESLQDETSGFAGTPLYLAPEIFAGASATVRSDLYSLGVLLYHLVTGSYPIRGSTTAEIRRAHAQRRRTWLRDERPDLPDRFVQAVERALEVDPEARYDSTGAMEAALARVASPSESPLPAMDIPSSSAAQILSNSRVSRAKWIAGVGLAAAGVAAVASGWWKSTSAALVPDNPRWILVSAFDDHTGDPRASEALQFAFEQELTQSRALTVVPRDRVADTLRLMKRPTTDRADATSAREICLRDGGIPLFTTARIDRIGAKYALALTVDDTRSGAAVLQAGVDAGTLDGLLDRVKGLAARVRSAIGEARQQVEGDAKLERVTTGSLEALDAYTRGMTFINERKWAAAEFTLREAVRIDPAFPSALIMLAHAIENQERPNADYAPFAERALQLSARLPSRERYFIDGSYSLIVERQPAKTIPVLEALVREYPNDFWGLNNLIASYGAVGAPVNAELLARRAALNPNDFANVVNAAERLVIQFGDLASARPLVARAAALRPNVREVLTIDAWIKMFPAFDLWANGHISEAATGLDAIAANIQGDEEAAGVGLMDVTLGRLRAAEDAFRAMSPTSERQEWLAYAALARNDTDAARVLLRADRHLIDQPRTEAKFSSSSWGKATLIIWTMIQSGLIDEAEVSARREAFQKDDFDGFIHAELAAARGDVHAAVPTLERVRHKAAPGSPQTMQAIVTLADALIAHGDTPGAEAILSQAGTRHTTYQFAGSRGYIWLLGRAKLLAVERQLGHMARASELERELRPLLVAADPDFSILRDIQ